MLPYCVPVRFYRHRCCDRCRVDAGHSQTEVITADDWSSTPRELENRPFCRKPFDLPCAASAAGKFFYFGLRQNLRRWHLGHSFTCMNLTNHAQGLSYSSLDRKST